MENHGITFKELHEIERHVHRLERAVHILARIVVKDQNELNTLLRDLHAPTHAASGFTVTNVKQPVFT